MKSIQEQRKKVVPLAHGRVLEVGIGPGFNLSYYDIHRVEFLWGLEPAQSMRKLARKNIEKSSVELKWIEATAEQIPLEDSSVDSVVSTYTLCTVTDLQSALSQIRRVLKPNGQLLFCEHGASPDSAVRVWQERLNPFWKTIAGGCHLNRDIAGCIENSGFELEIMGAEYLQGAPKFGGFNTWGVAHNVLGKSSA